MNKPNLSGLCRFHHISLVVNSLEESTSFYKDIFGFTHVTDFERKDLEGKVVFLKLDEMVLELWQFDNKKEAQDDINDLNILGYKHMCFQTEDVRSVYEKLNEDGVKTDEMIKGKTGTYFFMRDPNGYPIEIMELYK